MPWFVLSNDKDFDIFWYGIDNLASPKSKGRDEFLTVEMRKNRDRIPLCPAPRKIGDEEKNMYFVFFAPISLVDLLIPFIPIGIRLMSC